MAIYFVRDSLYTIADYPVYKIGVSKQGKGDDGVLHRIKAYGKYAEIYKVWEDLPCDCFKIEHDIKTFFRHNYELVKGNEWFKGDRMSMESDIDDIINMHAHPFDEHSRVVHWRLELVNSKEYIQLKNKHTRLSRRVVDYERILTEYVEKRGDFIYHTSFNAMSGKLRCCRENLDTAQHAFDFLYHRGHYLDDGRSKVDNKRMKELLRETEKSLDQHRDCRVEIWRKFEIDEDVPT